MTVEELLHPEMIVACANYDINFQDVQPMQFATAT